MNAPARVLVTAKAQVMLRNLLQTHGGLMFHQSGGCCDGSSPMCYPLGEYLIGDRDVLLGILDLRVDAGVPSPDLPTGADGVPVWISGSQFGAWKHTQLIIDLVPGRGSGFSLEGPEGFRFLSRGRVFSDDEVVALQSAPPVLGAAYAEGTLPPLPAEPTVVAVADEACPVPAR
ncbi:DUF779 domain-containing protein [Tsukamurella sp. 8F]|uniref:DUF779 domain-containing protein n=1 Tax=unclassified Tsukamurella TaxID=2633480 RepID=UPI0023B98624|nr:MULTISPECIES: DUF779 domain-containing protein [unclassified Tsukamurella]MDF0530453.1 DUF779 domain-containing protein [Tsukamurella sp. 8J]MDF0587726.1 DUF779 domain-containing protein [Tsukamurella sp. 8F]